MRRAFQHVTSPNPAVTPFTAPVELHALSLMRHAAAAPASGPTQHLAGDAVMMDAACGVCGALHAPPPPPGGGAAAPPAQGPVDPAATAVLANTAAASMQQVCERAATPSGVCVVARSGVPRQGARASL